MSDRPCCPKCGGTSGYTVAYAQRGREAKTWDDEDIDYHATWDWLGTERRCEDCGATFRRKPKCPKRRSQVKGVEKRDDLIRFLGGIR